MTNIKINDNRIIFDGHANTRQECETITLMCDNLAKSKDFKTIKYESGYAEFEKVGKTKELKFVNAPTEDWDIKLIFDAGITSVIGEPTETGGTYTWATSGSTQTVSAVFSDTEIIKFTPTLKQGYQIENVSIDFTDTYEHIYTVTISDDKKSVDIGIYSIGSLKSITITSKQSTAKQTIDVSTLSGWEDLASGEHSITIKTKASGYVDSASSNAVSVNKSGGYNVTLTTENDDEYMTAFAYTQYQIVKADGTTGSWETYPRTTTDAKTIEVPKDGSLNIRLKSSPGEPDTLIFTVDGTEIGRFSLVSETSPFSYTPTGDCTIVQSKIFEM